jgi:hypothetical protein
MLNVATKSKVILNLIQNVPGLMTKRAVKDLATNPKNNLLGFEDAAAAVSAIELSESDKKIVEDGENSSMLSDLFPNPRLAAELEIIKNTDRNKYQCFKDKMIELDSIAKEIDEAAGPSLDFLLDEIKEQSNDTAIDAVKNMGVSIINVEDGKIANK